MVHSTTASPAHPPAPEGSAPATRCRQASWPPPPRTASLWPASSLGPQRPWCAGHLGSQPAGSKMYMHAVHAFSSTTSVAHVGARVPACRRAGGGHHCCVVIRKTDPHNHAPAHMVSVYTSWQDSEPGSIYKVSCTTCIHVRSERPVHAYMHTSTGTVPADNHPCGDY